MSTPFRQDSYSARGGAAGRDRIRRHPGSARSAHPGQPGEHRPPRGDAVGCVGDRHEKILGKPEPAGGGRHSAPEGREARGGRARQVQARRWCAVAGRVRAEMPEVPVRGILCFVDSEWPLLAGPFRVNGVEVLWPRKLVGRLTAAGPAVVDVDAVAGVLGSGSGRLEATVSGSPRRGQSRDLVGGSRADDLRVIWGAEPQSLKCARTSAAWSLLSSQRVSCRLASKPNRLRR